jgi:hypothetical protein
MLCVRIALFPATSHGESGCCTQVSPDALSVILSTEADENGTCSPHDADPHLRSGLIATMAATRAPVPDERADRHALAAFAVDNPDFERLEALLAQFNLFDAFGMTRQELRHSDFLAFLLDPRQTHGLGAAFVTSLLQRVLMVVGPVARAAGVALYRPPAGR